ncbi:response regulator transcription factor [Caproiciproducens sp. LBM24188]
MVSVFLVEDEFVVREGMKKNVDWAGSGIKFLGEAADGELAYPQIQKLKPDIVITDIKMPFMDGLDLSRLIRKELPKTKIMILSGYGDFDYAKQAISIGVTDYLLKPISSEKLLEAVQHVAGVVRQEREKEENLRRFEEEMKENEDLARSKYFDEVISGQLSSAEIISKGKSRKIDLVAGYFRIVLYEVNDAAQSEETVCYSDKVVQFMEALQKKEKELPRVDVFPRGVEGLAFLVKADTQAELEANTESLLSLLGSLRESVGELRYFAAIGSPTHRPKGIAESFYGARRVFAYRYLGQKNRVVRYDESESFKVVDDCQQNSVEISASALDRNVVRNFLRNGLLSEAPAFTENFFIQLGNNNLASMMFRQYVTMDLYLCAAAFLREIGYSEENIWKYTGSIHAISAALVSVQQTKACMTKIIRQTIVARDYKATKRYGGLIEKAKAYIDKNYANREISLNTTAQSVNLSPNHFSTIFSQETGVTFIEYLTNLRMKKAREMLRCTDAKTSEIAYRVGYQDPHYFSYLFRKINGCSPREYREKR